jgi:cell division protein FtsL
MKSKHFATIILATVFTCAFVWVRLQIISISYDINELTKQERFLREECNHLSLQINEVRSPAKLERLAANKFKMMPPRAEQLITLGAAK